MGEARDNDLSSVDSSVKMVPKPRGFGAHARRNLGIPTPEDGSASKICTAELANDCASGGIHRDGAPATLRQATTPRMHRNWRKVQLGQATERLSVHEAFVSGSGAVRGNANGIEDHLFLRADPRYD
jgi:hypothetical protein